MFAGSPVQAAIAIAIAVPLVLLLLTIALLSIHRIGPNEVGLVIRRWGPDAREGGPIAFHGEAGYQADLLMPGVAVRVWPMNRVEKHPVGADSDRRSRPRHRTGRCAVANGMEVRRLQACLRSVHRRPYLRRRGRTAGRAAAGASSGSDPAAASGRVPRALAEPQLRAAGQRRVPRPLRPRALWTRARGADAAGDRAAQDPRERRRQDRSTSSASSRRSRASRCRPATSRAGWVASTTCARWKPRAAATPRSPTC